MILNDNFESLLTDNFKTAIFKKIAWGKTDIMLQFANVLSDTLNQSIVKQNNELCVNIQNDEIVDTKHDLDRIQEEITSAQVWRINQIENHLSEMNIKFKGSNKNEASFFITRYINKDVNDILPKGVL
jgi:hypothetical protein